MRKIIAVLALLLATSAVRAQPKYCYGIDSLTNNYYRYDTVAQSNLYLGQIGAGSGTWGTGRYVYGATYKVGSAANSLIMDNKGAMWIVTPVNVHAPLLLATTNIVSYYGCTPLSLASSPDGLGGYDYYCVAYKYISGTFYSILFKLEIVPPYTATNLGEISLNGSTANVFVTQIAGDPNAGAGYFWATDSGSNWYTLDASGPSLNLLSSGNANVAGMDWYQTGGGGYGVVGLDDTANPPYVCTVDTSDGSCTTLFRVGGASQIMTATK